MNLLDVAQELSDELGTILNGRATPFAPDTVTPPCGYVFGPETAYDSSYQRGLDVVTLSVTVLVARAPLEVAWKEIGAYVSGSGDKSVKALLEAGEYRSFDTIQVTRSQIGDATTSGGNEYKAALFTITITGSGTGA